MVLSRPSLAAAAGATLVDEHGHREARIRLAEQRFEDELKWAGESVCIGSLPLLVDEVVAAASGDDEGLATEIETRLRRRAGLHTSSGGGGPGWGVVGG